MVRTPDLKSVGHGLKFRSEQKVRVVSCHTLVHILGRACKLIAKCLPLQSGFLNLLCLLKYFFLIV